jgi:serine/threonine protein kinase
MQRAEGRCSMCGSNGGNKVTCPLNPEAVNINYEKHVKAMQLNDTCSFDSPEICLGLNMTIYDKTQLDKIDKNLDGYTYNGRPVITLSKHLIAEGGHGTVNKIVIDTTNGAVSFVSKMSISEDNLDEHDVLQLYPNIAKVCNTCIPFKILNDKEAIMPLAHGELKDLIPMKKTHALKTVKCIRDSLQSLYSVGAMYLDIKSENILYICQKNKVQIYLADIGSVVPTMDDDEGVSYICSHPPLEFGRGIIPLHKVEKHYKAIYTYLLIMLFCELMYPAGSVPKYRDRYESALDKLIALVEKLETDHPPFADILSQEYIDGCGLLNVTPYHKLIL